MAELTEREDLRCSFCGKLQSEVEHLIAGPDVYICDKCVGICVEIVNHGKPSRKNKVSRPV